jgi:hypothetical protein
MVWREEEKERGEEERYIKKERGVVGSGCGVCLRIRDFMRAYGPREQWTGSSMVWERGRKGEEKKKRRREEEKKRRREEEKIRKKGKKEGRGVVDVVYASVFVILCGLMVHVSSGRAPAWYEEKGKKGKKDVARKEMWQGKRCEQEKKGVGKKRGGVKDRNVSPPQGTPI